MLMSCNQSWITAVLLTKQIQQQSTPSLSVPKLAMKLVTMTLDGIGQTQRIWMVYPLEVTLCT
jgi:hypothetical protein